MENIIVTNAIIDKTQRCPRCHKEEDIIKVCANCAYKYPPSNRNKNENKQIIFVLVLGIITGLLLSAFINS